MNFPTNHASWIKATIKIQSLVSATYWNSTNERISVEKIDYGGSAQRCEFMYSGGVEYGFLLYKWVSSLDYGDMWLVIGVPKGLLLQQSLNLGLNSLSDLCVLCCALLGLLKSCPIV